MSIQNWYYGTFRTRILLTIWDEFLNWCFDWLRGSQWKRHLVSINLKTCPEFCIDDIFSGMYDVIRRIVWYWSVSLVSAPVVKYRIKDWIGSSENSSLPESFHIWVFIELLKWRLQMLLTIFGDEICWRKFLSIQSHQDKSVTNITSTNVNRCFNHFPEKLCKFHSHGYMKSKTFHP